MSLEDGSRNKRPLEGGHLLLFIDLVVLFVSLLLLERVPWSVRLSLGIEGSRGRKKDLLRVDCRGQVSTKVFGSDTQKEGKRVSIRPFCGGCEGRRHPNSSLFFLGNQLKDAEILHFSLAY